MTPDECRAIIRVALKTIGLWSEAAEDLLLGTAIQESGLVHVRQTVGGPALGLWQMEPATHDDIWMTYLTFRSRLADKVALLAGMEELSPELMVTNHQYACAMARIKYRRSPLPLPDFGDVVGYAAYWKKIFNTPNGRGTEEEFVENWNHFVT